MENRLVVYPVPEGAVMQEDYLVRVRPLGTQTWQSLPCYRVKIDMHDVREASMAYFDFEGAVEVEITFPKFYTVYKTEIRPLSLGIQPLIEPRRVSFILKQAVNLAVEINKDRFHNLHLFAGRLEKVPDGNGENVLMLEGNLEKACFLGDDINRKLEAMPEGRLLWIKPGLYYIGDFLWHIPSHTRVYLEGGVVIRGCLVCEHAEDIHIFGRGIFYQAHLDRFSGANGIRISHCSNISLAGLIFINPPHYTVSLGQSKDIRIRNIKTFSCEGWSDGIDMMSCEDVMIEGGFLRTSDDCIAIYGSRWDNRGGSRRVTVRGTVLWADVAHPLMIGTHGNHEGEGDVIEDILFEDIDILEHHEFQPDYLGAMAINAGDKNIVRNVTYKNIRIEPFEHGKVLDIQVKWNRDYNPAPGRQIQGVRFEGLHVMTGDGEEPSVICGLDEGHPVEDVVIAGYFRDGKKVENLREGNIAVGSFTRNICLE